MHSSTHTDPTKPTVGERVEGLVHGNTHNTTGTTGHDQHSTGLAGQQHGLASHQQQPIGGAYGDAHGGAPLSGTAHGAHSSTTGGGIGEKLGNALPGGGHTSTSTTGTGYGTGVGGGVGHHDNTYGDNRTTGEKLKDALPGGNSSHSTGTHHSTTGTGTGYGTTGGLGHDNTYGSNTNTAYGDNRTMTEKAKDALPGGNSAHTGTTHHTSTTGAGGVGSGLGHNTTHSTTGAGGLGHDSTHTHDNRTLTEKAKDAMPGNNTATHGTHGTTGTTGATTGLGHDNTHHTTGTGLGHDNTHSHGSGLTGDSSHHTTTGSHSAAVPHKPTVGEKIGGTVEKLVGKVTSNPEKVAHGEAKATGQPLSGAAAGAHEAVRH